MSIQRPTNPLLLTISIFVLILLGLTVSQRFGATWAGGDGISEATVTIERMQGSATYQAHDAEPVDVTGADLKRGGIVRTGDDGYLHLRIGDLAHVMMAERTDVVLVSLSEDSLEITVSRGRVVTSIMDPSSPLVIQTNHTTTTQSEGQLSLINFDFLENVILVPMHYAEATYCTDLGCNPLEGVVEIHETDPVSVEVREDFLLDDPFYTWTPN